MPTTGYARHGKFYTWTFPGAPVIIHLDLNLIRELRNQIASGHPEARGVLLGAVQPEGIVISEFKKVPSEAADRESSVLERWRLAVTNSVNREANIVPVGYFRVHGGVQLLLSDDDLEIIRTCFTKKVDVFLVVAAAEVIPQAGFFFWDNDQICSDFTFLPFSFDSDELALQSPHQAQPTRPNGASAASAQELQNEARAPGTSAKKKPWPGKPWARTVAYVAGIAVLAFCVFVSYLWRSRRNPVLSQNSPAASLVLFVECQSGDFRVTWDGSNAALANARVGVFSITDGTSPRNIYLDPGQLRNGSVLYSPVSDHVQFRLDVFSNDGSRHSNDVLAVNGRFSGPDAKLPRGTEDRTRVRILSQGPTALPGAAQARSLRQPAPLDAGGSRPKGVHKRSANLNLPSPNTSDSGSILGPP